LCASLVEAEPAATVENSLGMKLVLIKPGTFMMGAGAGELSRNDETRHKVTITKPFYIAIHEVTVKAFREFVDDMSKREGRPWLSDAEKGGQAFENGQKGGYMINTDGTDEWKTSFSWRTPPFPQTPDHPVIFLSWNDADAFVKCLSDKEKKHYRLPTEAEWEYACRGGKATAYSWGPNPDTTGKVANVADRSFHKQFPRILGFMDMDDGNTFTAPVGNYTPNGFGLYDMIGNAWEWVADYYAGDFLRAQKTNPKGPEQGTDKIARGGGWGTTPDRARCAARFRDLAQNRFAGTSLRIAMDVETATAP
jgi:sulfatase modifying factor 1